MKKIFLLSLLLFLQACSRPPAPSVPPVPTAKELNQKMDQCLAMQKGESQVFGRFGKPGSGDDFGNWIVFKQADPDLVPYDSLSIWKRDDLQDVVLEATTPSGGWYRIDDYCFNKDNTIVGLYSDLRTFYGHVKVIRTWLYGANGETIKMDKKIFDLDTDKPINPDPNSYQDDPPFLTSRLENLLTEIELPASLLTE